MYFAHTAPVSGQMTDFTISIFFVVDNKFFRELSGLFLYVDTEDRSLLQDVPERDVRLVSMKHRDARADKFKVSDFVGFDVVKTREGWA